MGSPPRVVLVIAVVVGLFALRGLATGSVSVGGAPVPTGFEETFEIDPGHRQATLRFAPGVAPADQQWFLAAVAAARPEAQRLIAEVDGLVEVRTHVGDPFGVTHGSSSGFVISLDIASLNRDRVSDREVTVLHEFGHVIDHALVDSELNDRLEAGIPRAACVNATQVTGSCTEPAERFADTFAKWALRGAVSAAGAGYGVATPASLEDWGAPLVVLSNQVATR